MSTNIVCNSLLSDILSIENTLCRTVFLSAKTPFIYEPNLLTLFPYTRECRSPEQRGRWVTGHKEGKVCFVQRKPLPRSTANSTVSDCFAHLDIVDSYWKRCKDCFNIHLQMWTAVAQWLRCCATNRNVAGSIPDGAIGIFHWYNPSDRSLALGSTQPLTKMSTKNIYWAEKAVGT